MMSGRWRWPLRYDVKNGQCLRHGTSVAWDSSPCGSCAEDAPIPATRRVAVAVLFIRARLKPCWYLQIAIPRTNETAVISAHWFLWSARRRAEEYRAHGFSGLVCDWRPLPLRRQDAGIIEEWTGWR